MNDKKIISICQKYVFYLIFNLQSSYLLFKTQLISFSMMLVAHASKFLHDVETYLPPLYHIYIIIYPIFLVIC